jgi:hypothetical protein
MRFPLSRKKTALATACAILTTLPEFAHAHGDIEGAIAYLAGSLLSLFLVLVAVLVARLGWKWLAAALLLGLIANVSYGLVPRANLPSWSLSQNAAFVGGLLPAIVSTTLLIFAVRVYRRPLDTSPRRGTLYLLGVIGLLLMVGTLGLFGYLPTLTPNPSMQSGPAQAPAADFKR